VINLKNQKVNKVNTHNLHFKNEPKIYRGKFICELFIRGEKIVIFREKFRENVLKERKGT